MGATREYRVYIAESKEWGICTMLIDADLTREPGFKVEHYFVSKWHGCIEEKGVVQVMGDTEYLTDTLENSY